MRGLGHRLRGHGRRFRLTETLGRNRTGGRAGDSGRPLDAGVTIARHLTGQRGEWELAGSTNGGSRMYPTLDKYQRDGYQSLMKIANQHGGAFLCDGVGLGKTFIGMMLIERLVEKDRQRVALFVPKAARGPVWEAKLRQYLPHIGGDFSSLAIFNHTDLLRGGEFQERLDRIAERADIIMIDEAHHFRNPGVKGEEGARKTQYWRLFDIAQGKRMFLLTVTPVNNRLIDLQHMMESIIC